MPSRIGRLMRALEDAMKRPSLLAVVLLVVVACGGPEPAPPFEPGPDADADGHTAPTAATGAANRATGAALPLADEADFENARRGLLARDEALVIAGPDGGGLWDLPAYAFLDGDVPASVNPSLWRQARLNNIHGLFEVTKGVYQVRGYDLANMTLIEGETGWIVVDPLTSAETAAAAFDLANRTLGERPISAIIFTHSHGDHFGGVGGVISAEEVEERGVPIVAPARFLEEATSENVLAGVAMSRRASFMYGRRLARSPRGHVDSGLGKSPALGTIGILPPTEIVDRTPQEMVLDGVRFVFQYTPESEAPAELTFYLPDRKAFCGAEIVSHTMHNLYTLRGAKVRDALRWSGYVDEAMTLFPDVEVMFASHHWPMWGNESILDYLGKQRDTYKYIHDQTLRLANQGRRPAEIAEVLELPPELAVSLPNRGYYGTVRHNSRAVYQWYFGWYDANPAHLNPHPPVEEAKRYVEYMGGADAVLEKAQASFDSGDYRWVATVLDHVVFADPDNAEARGLLARAYDQLGYQAESAPWRDVYLSAAYELRHGGPDQPLSLAAATDLLRHTPMERFLESMAARLNGPDAEGKQMKLNFIFPDVGETHVLTLENSVLHHRRGEPDPEASVTVRVTKELLVRLVAGQAGVRELVFGDEMDIDGSRLDLLEFFGLLDAPDPSFGIVTP
jgi:alkyl sulfatase BDS1-like metallo-beta-lactamase superfamily hydrolase